MANLICPVCGDEYADWATACSTCRVALVDAAEVHDVLTLPESQQVVYELADWSIDQRADASQALAEAGISHGWDGTDLVVHISSEATADRLLEEIEPSAEAADFAPGTETEYDMAEWPDDERAAVEARLLEAEVPFRWEGSLLLVPAEEEGVVDDILDDVEAGGDAASLADDGNETPFEVLESMFLAAGRLRNDPIDAEGVTRLAAAMDEADPERPPFGIEMTVWQRVMAAADDVADAVGNDDGVDPDSAIDASERLHELLRPFV